MALDLLPVRALYCCLVRFLGHINLRPARRPSVGISGRDRFHHEEPRKSETHPRKLGTLAADSSQILSPLGPKHLIARHLTSSGKVHAVEEDLSVTRSDGDLRRSIRLQLDALHEHN